MYNLLGDRVQVNRILAALSAYDSVSATEAPAAIDTVESLVGLERPAAAIPIAAALLNGGASPPDVFGKLFPRAPLAAEIWWRYERLQHPDEPMRTTVARLPALLSKHLARPDGLAALESAAKIARTQADTDADKWLQGLAEACQSAGLDAQARAFAQEAAERSKSAAAWLRLGDLQVEGRQYAAAATAYRRAGQADAKSALALWLHGWAMEKAGQPGGLKVQQLAHTILLADESARSKLAEELAKRSAFGPELMTAALGERRLILKVSSPTSNFGRGAQYELGRAAGANADRAAVADGTQRFLFRLLRTNTYFKKEQGYLSVLHRQANQRSLALLDKGDVAGAVHEAEAALALLPAASEPASTLVPELAKRGHTAEADRVYAATAAVEDRLCKDYPQSAEFHNNRAWLAARCRRDLDLAVAYGRKAVDLEPHRVGFHDTLGEALFQHGDQAAALAEVKRCIELDPKNQYFVRQQKRVEAGDRAAALPER